MRRVVVTGMGLVSCLGHDKETVTKSLREGKSGISFNETFKEMGLRSHVSGSIEIDLGEHIDRKHLRFMGDAASFAYISLQKAIDDAGLDAEQVSNPRTGLIAGSGSIVALALGAIAVTVGAAGCDPQADTSTASHNKVSTIISFSACFRCTFIQKDTPHSYCFIRLPGPEPPRPGRYLGYRRVFSVGSIPSV